MWFWLWGLQGQKTYIAGNVIQRQREVTGNARTHWCIGGGDSGVCSTSWDEKAGTAYPQKILKGTLGDAEVLCQDPIFNTKMNFMSKNYHNLRMNLKKSLAAHGVNNSYSLIFPEAGPKHNIYHIYWSLRANCDITQGSLKI